MKDKLAIFDLDGTLFDTKNVNYCAYKAALEPFGYSIDYQYYCAFCNGRYYKDFLPQIATSDSDILQRIHTLKKQFYTQYLNQARPNIHLLRIVKLLRSQFYTAVVTSASRKNCEDLLEHFHASDYFDRVFSHEDVSRKKPDPEGFLCAMRYFGVSPEQTIIFEDSETGIEAAKRSGAEYYIVTGYN